jgi:hypothetical protein
LWHFVYVVFFYVLLVPFFLCCMFHVLLKNISRTAKFLPTFG